MTLIVEDGTGVSGAESYNTVVEFKAYWEKFGKSQEVCGFDDCKIEVALRQSGVYHQSEYAQCFIGDKSTKEQGLHFPIKNRTLREDGLILEVDEIPVEIKNAENELAFKTLDGTSLFPSDVVDVQTGVTEIFEKIGPIEEKVSYKSGSGPIPETFYQKVDSMLWPILDGVEGFTRIIRN